MQWRLARVLELCRPGVRGADEHEAPCADRGGGLDERFERVAPEQRVRREGVGAQAFHRPERPRGLAHERLGVSAGGQRNVAPLRIRQDQ